MMEVQKVVDSLIVPKIVVKKWMAECLEEFREELEALFTDPGDNVLDMLDVGNPERPHTWILEWVLDPAAEHGGGAAFQEALGEEIGLDERLSPASVDSFVSNLGSDKLEIDEVLTRDGEVCVGVEIKTTYPANKGELEDELKVLREHYHTYSVYKLVYLTHDPDSKPDVSDDAYERITWGKLAEAFYPRIEDANEEWHGFLNHLFTHFQETIMEPEGLKDLEGEFEKSAIYAYNVEFIKKAKDSYERVCRQFLEDINSEINGNSPQFEPKLNYTTDLTSGLRSPPENLSIYLKEWPKAQISNEDEELTVRFDIHLRHSARNTTAQKNNPLSTPLGIEVNFDILTENDNELKREVRGEFNERLPSETKNELQEDGYEIDTSLNATKHVIGKLLEREWPPERKDVEAVVEEFDRLLQAVYEPATEAKEVVREGAN